MKIPVGAEYGQTGLVAWNGRPVERYLTSLHGSAGCQKFNEMLRQEPACFTADRLVRLTAQQTRWTVVPAGDAAPERAAAEFLEGCLEDMSHSLATAIDNAMTAHWFGFSLLEIVWKRRLGRNAPQAGSAFNDGRIGIRKLALRRQETISRWVFDDHGGIQAAVQQDDMGREVTIPIEKLLHFVVIPDRGNPEGLALAEVAYKPYHMLQNFEIIDGIGAERAHIGLPVIKWLQKPADDDKAAAEEMARNLVVNEQQFVTLPGPMAEFELVSITNTNADALRARINQLRWEIVGIVFGNFIRLGTTDTGNRALSETLADAFTKGVDAVLVQIAEVLNHHLIPRLFTYNNFAATLYPRLQPTRINKLPLFVLQYLEAVQSWLAAAPDEDNLWLREMLGMPYVALRYQAPPQAPAVAAQKQDTAPTTDEESAVAALAPIDNREVQLLAQVAEQLARAGDALQNAVAPTELSHAHV